MIKTSEAQNSNCHQEQRQLYLANDVEVASSVSIPAPPEDSRDGEVTSGGATIGGGTPVGQRLQEGHISGIRVVSTCLANDERELVSAISCTSTVACQFRLL